MANFSQSVVDPIGVRHRLMLDALRDRREIGGATAVGYFRARSLTEGGCVAWVLRLVEIGAEGEGPCADVVEISRPDGLVDIADLGLTLAEAKLVLAGVQREIVAAPARDHAVRRPGCRRCAGVCRVTDYRQHAIATLFGQVAVRLPRFRCAGCGTTGTGVQWPPYARSTPELDRLRAQLSALLTYRTAADLLGQMFPVDAGQDPETLRRHTFQIAKTLSMTSAAEAPVSVDAKAIVVTLDSTFIRSCEDGERHLEVRIGNVETEFGGRQVFGAVAKVNTDIGALLRHALDAIGRTGDTALTAFTDGCPGLRRILADAGVTAPPMLDWFHLAMRLQHLKQVAGVLSDEDPARGAGKAIDHHGGRALALAHLERQGQGRADQHRSHSRTLALLQEQARSQAAAGARRGGPLSTLPERPSGRLRRTAPGRAAGRHGADRGHGQLPGEPPHGQGAADALDPARGRSAAPGPLRPLQRHARHRFRAEIPADQRPTPANGGSRLTPNFV